MTQDPDYEPPNIPYTRWTGEVCKKWLNSRGYDVTELNAADAKSQVSTLMQQPGGPPGISPPSGGSVEVVLSMMIALDKMVRILMVSAFPVGGKDILRLQIIQFLNCFETFSHSWTMVNYLIG